MENVGDFVILFIVWCFFFKLNIIIKNFYSIFLFKIVIDLNEKMVKVKILFNF